MNTDDEPQTLSGIPSSYGVVTFSIREDPQVDSGSVDTRSIPRQ